MEEKYEPDMQMNNDPADPIGGVVCVPDEEGTVPQENEIANHAAESEAAEEETGILENPEGNEPEEREDQGRVWFVLGVIFIMAALGLVLYNRAEAKRADQAAGHITNGIEETLSKNRQPVYDSVNDFLRVHAHDTENPTYPVYLMDPDAKMPVKEVDGIPCIALLEIPVLDLELPIGDEWDYDRLKSIPCRYHGNLYAKDLVICGHNYERHFGNLKLLEPGDEIYVTDMQGTVFPFTVTEVEIRSPRDINGMIYGNDWDLTLYTCTPNGRSRVTVRCVQT